MAVSRGWEGAGHGELLLSGSQVSVWDGEKILEIDHSSGESNTIALYA